MGTFLKKTCIVTLLTLLPTLVFAASPEKIAIVKDALVRNHCIPADATKEITREVVEWIDKSETGIANFNESLHATDADCRIEVKGKNLSINGENIFGDTPTSSVLTINGNNNNVISNSPSSTINVNTALRLNLPEIIEGAPAFAIGVYSLIKIFRKVKKPKPHIFLK